MALEGDFGDFVSASFDPQRMSAVYPARLAPYIADLQERFGGKLRVLDVGCGPSSLLSRGQLQGWFDLICVDPLAEEYRALTVRLGKQTVGAMQKGFGESLSALFEPGSFDLVFCCNALDHTQSPGLAVAEMCRVLRPGGTLFLQGYSREGSANKFHGLHQHDLYVLEGGRLMCEDRLWPLRRGGRARCISETLPLDVISQSEETSIVKSPMLAVYRKRSA